MMSRSASSIRRLGALLLAAALASCGGRAPATGAAPGIRRRAARSHRLRKRAAQYVARRAVRGGAALQPAVRDDPRTQNRLRQDRRHVRVGRRRAARVARSDGGRAAADVRLREAHARGEDVVRPLDLRARSCREGEAVPPPLLRLHSDGRPANEPARGADQLPSRRRRGRHARVRRADRRRRARDRPIRRAREARRGRGRARASVRGHRGARAVPRARQRRAVRRRRRRTALGGREDEDRRACCGREDRCHGGRRAAHGGARGARDSSSSPHTTR